MSKPHLNYLQELPEEMILFGAGGLLSYALAEANRQGRVVRFISDNNPNHHGKFFNGILCIPPAAIRETQLPVLITSMYAREIARQLLEYQVEKVQDFSYVFDRGRWIHHFDPSIIEKNQESIRHCLELLEDRHSRETLNSLLEYRQTRNPADIIKADYPDYFHPVVSPQPGDTIIDGGAWHGDSALLFHNKLKGDCQIYCFEPEAENLSLLEKTIKNHQLATTTAVPYGLYSEPRQLHFTKSNEHSMQSHVSNQVTGLVIDVVSLDALPGLGSSQINFIKMDIEGSEQAALLGASHILVTQRPKLAICSYHTPTDLWEIPLLIKQLNPDYRIFVGHHSSNLFETTVYAI